ncbi:MAG: AsmA family protein [Alphaproteobacteria bacterium]|nr:AsmA family protein [Alphaproteobacteria bacterium]
MKKALLVVFAMVLVFLGVLLVAPVFIDWNSYRRDVAAAIADATGREVTIAGDLDLSILPVPRLTARRVSVANIGGATDPEMLRIGELHMELAVAPLLAGRIAVRSLSLIDAAVILETTADGRHSWDLAPARPARAPTGLVAGISVDAVSISNGRVVWRAADSGPWQLDGIEATLTISKSTGAVHGHGSAVFETVPFRFLANVGTIGTDGTAPVSAAIDVAGGAGALAAMGRADIDRRWAAGTVRLTAPDAARLALALGRESGPAMPAWPVSLESEFTLDRDAVALNDIAATYGGIRGTGLAELDLGKALALVAELRIATMDLDDVLAATDPGMPAGGTQNGLRPAWENLRLPGGFTADLDLAVRAARWRGGVVRDIGASLRLGPEGVAIERMAAILPGGTSITLAGIAKPSGQELQLDGDLAVISDNLRAALIWAGAADGELPRDRLRSFSYTSRITVTPDAVHLAGIAGRLDATRMTGAATVARQVRPSFGIRLRLDRLGLDAYLPRWARRRAGAGGRDGHGIPGAGRFDANLNLFIESLAVQGKAVSQVALDARLFDGDVILRKLSIGDLGGATLSASGKIDDLPGAPHGDLEIVLEAGDTERFAGFMDFGAGAIAPRVGRFRLSGRAAGSAGSATVGGTLEIAGGKVQAEGLLSDLDGKAGFDLAVTASHPDSDRVLNLFAPGRSRGEIGMMTMKFGLAGTADALAIRNLDSALGKMRIAGRIDAAFGGNHPKAVAALSAGLLDLDRLWPAVPRPSRNRATPAARGSARWSRETFDLSALRALDLDLKLRSDTVVRSRIRIDGLDLHTVITGGVLTVDRLTGTLFGGSIEASGRIDAAAPDTDIAASVSGRDIPARHALDAIAAVDRVEGPVAFSLSLSAKGHSPFDLVSSLSGSASLAGTLRAQRRGNEPIPAGPAGDAMDALLKAFAGAPAALSADLRIENGTARTGNLLLDGDVMGALTLGAMDIPGWRIDSTTTVRRHQDGGEPPDLVVRISGPLGDPAVELSGAAVGQDRDEAPAPEAAPVISVEPVAPAAQYRQGIP